MYIETEGNTLDHTVSGEDRIASHGRNPSPGMVGIA
jgi:hypothetical protein